MTKEVTKWFWIWDFQEEEDWLNEMANQGWTLTHAGFIKYEFERTEPEEYTIRIEMRNATDDDYISFLESTGVEYICSYGKWNYYRKASTLGDFEIFQGLDSRIQHLKSILKAILAIGLLNLGISMTNITHVGLFALVNMVIFGFAMYGYGKIKTTISFLEKERNIRE